MDPNIDVLAQVVGGEDKYRAVCRACYNKALAEKAKQRRRQSIGVIRCDALYRITTCIAIGDR